MSYDDFKKRALVYIENLNRGDTFLLRDIDNGADYQGLPLTERMQFGRLFAQDVANANISNIVRVRNTSPIVYEKLILER